MVTTDTKRIAIRVLLAEDESLVGDVIEHELEKAGYEVAGRANNGSQAVELTQELKPDIVLMDIEMPKMNGLDAMRNIFDTHPVPVILLTAHDTESFIIEAGMIGAAGYLVKPSNFREIDRAITIGLARFNDIMELRRLNRQLQEAMEKVKLLSGLLPICSECGHVRNDQGSWEALEEYLSVSAGTKLMHGICPDCRTKYASAREADAGRARTAKAPAPMGSLGSAGHDVVMSGGTVQVFKRADIKYIEAQDEHSIVHTADGRKHVVRRLLKEWEKDESGTPLLRVHRSTLVNLSHVAKIEKWFNHTFRIFIRDVKEPIVMSRRYSALLRGKMKKELPE